MKKRVSCLGTVLFLCVIFISTGFAERLPTGIKTDSYEAMFGETIWLKTKSQLSIRAQEVVVFRWGGFSLTDRADRKHLWLRGLISPDNFSLTRKGDNKATALWHIKDTKNLGFTADWKVECLPKQIELSSNYRFARDINANLSCWPRLFQDNPDLIKGCKVDLLLENGNVLSTTFPKEYSNKKWTFNIKAAKMYTKIGKVAIKISQQKSYQDILFGLHSNKAKKYDCYLGFRLTGDDYPYKNEIRIEIAFDDEADNLFESAVNENPVLVKKDRPENFLLGDTGFETGIMGEGGWKIYNGFLGSIDNTTAAEGKRSLRIKPGPVAMLQWHTYQIELGEVDTFSAYMKSNSPQKVRMRIKLESKVLCEKVFNLTNSWKRYSVTTIPTPSVGYFELSVLNKGDGEIWIDGLQLEKGKKATAYKPYQDIVFSLDTKTPGNLYFKDESKILVYRFYNPGSEDRKLEFAYSINDYYGRRVKEGRVPLALTAKGHHSIPIELKLKERGFFVSRCEILEKDKVVAKGEGTFSILPYTQKEVDRKDPFFGCWAGMWSQGKEPVESLSRIGVGTARIQTSWVYLEPEKGKFYWEFLDKGVELLNSHKIDVMALIGTAPPAWAKAHKKWGSCPYTKEFKEHVHQIVKRYKGRIKYYEFFNEIDHYVRTDYDEVAQSRGISRAQLFAELVKEGYQTAKKVDPECRILTWAAAGPGHNWWLANGGKAFADEFLPLARDYFDIFTFHPYPETGLVGPRGNTSITDLGMKKKLKTTVDYFNAKGWKKEMWAGEQGWRLDYSVPPDSIYAKEYARTVTKSLAQTRSFPQIKRFVWHADTGIPISGYSFGLWRKYCYPLPAVNAYATTAWMLKNVEDGKELNLHSEDIEGYIFPRKKETVAVIWVNRGKEKAQLAFTCNPDDIEVIDYMGNPVSINRSEDGFTFNFERDPIFIKSERIPFSSLTNMIEEGIFFAKPLKVEITGLKLPRIQVLLTSQDKQELFGKAKIKITPHQELTIFEREFHLSPYGTQTLEFELSKIRIGELKHSTMEITITTPQIEFTSTTRLNFLYCSRGKPDKIDGSLSDWPKKEPIYLNQRNQVLPSGAGVWNGEDDLSAVAYFMYDDEYLYFGADVKDDVHINDRPASTLYRADGIQIGTGDSECYEEIGIALTSSGIKSNKDSGSNAGKPVKGIKIAIKEKDNKKGLIYEVAIPLDAFQPMRILPGKMIPFAFIINDEDGKGRKWMGIDNPAVLGATKDVKTYPLFLFGP